jgi:hypothetical protein
VRHAAGHAGAHPAALSHPVQQVRRPAGVSDSRVGVRHRRGSPARHRRRRTPRGASAHRAAPPHPAQQVRRPAWVRDSREGVRHRHGSHARRRRSTPRGAGAHPAALSHPAQQVRRPARMRDGMEGVRHRRGSLCPSPALRDPSARSSSHRCPRRAGTHCTIPA